MNSKPILLADAPDKLQRHVVNRIADLTEEFTTRVEDLCKLNNIDYSDTMLYLANSMPMYLKALSALSYSTKHSADPAVAIISALFAAGIDPRDFDEFIRKEEERSKREARRKKP